MDFEEHQLNTAILCLKIAEELKLSEEEKNVLKVAAIIHDIGKTKIPKEILFKAGSLSVEEFELIRKHPTIGAEIVKRQGYGNENEVVKAVKYHHERYDGKGYPEGLKGQDIPLYSRIIAVADSFDAMISNRTYRTCISAEKALNDIVKNSGTQFDPKIVNAFVKVYKAQTEQ